MSWPMLQAYLLVLRTRSADWLDVFLVHEPVHDALHVALPATPGIVLQRFDDAVDVLEGEGGFERERLR